MEKSGAGRVIVGSLVALSGALAVIIFGSMFLPDRSVPRALNVLTTPFGMGPYGFGAFLLSQVMAKRSARMRGGAAGIFAINVVFAAPWLVLADESRGFLLAARIGWHIALPLLVIALLYSPSVTRLISVTPGAEQGLAR